MSKYIKLEDIETLITACEWRMTLAKERHGEGFVDYSKQVLDVDELTKRLSNLPTIEVSEDDLYIPLNNQTVERINRLHKDECGEYFDEEWLFNELEQISEFREVSEDCISKHDIWKIIEDNAYWVRYNENSTEKGMTLTGINQALNECPLVAPSVVPSRAEGEWIVRANGNNECSICGREKQNGWVNFCGFCGAKMKGAER